MNNKAWCKARFAIAWPLALLLGAVWTGQAQGGYADCRLCHLDPAPGSMAKDYFDYFARPQRQHPTGMPYPAVQNADFFRPTAQAGDIAFFDSNNNGVADFDEIQLFGPEGKVECASCHREHGGDAPPPAQPGMYLRQRVGTLCMVCHRT